MTALVEKTRCTPEDLLTMRDGDLYELVDGELVERNMGGKSSWIGGELHGNLWSFNKDARLGWVFPADASYQCFQEDPTRVRRPDTSFIRFGRLPGEQPPDGHIRTVPDLAVEVVSPNDLYSEVRTKVEEYLRAGVRLVWVIDPDTRSVDVRRADGSVSQLGEKDELTGEDVLPGFRCAVRDLFPPLPAENGQE